jgi:hypothetical protein
MEAAKSTRVPQVLPHLMPVALELYKGIKQLIARRSSDDPCRILEYDLVLELLDAGGRRTTFRKSELIQFYKSRCIWSETMPGAEASSFRVTNVPRDLRSIVTRTGIAGRS